MPEYIVLGVIALVLLYLVSTYNKLVRLRVGKNEAWSDIEVQMKRRYNLVPNLVETVKGYAGHEKDTLERVIAARGAAVSAGGSPGEQAGAENIFTGALRQLLAVSEAYPELKADKGFIKLQDELSSLEDIIQKARRFFNGNVREMNMAVQEFPSNIIAGLFNFENGEFFELDEAEAEAAKQAPKVQF
jgi:LemA protein